MASIEQRPILIESGGNAQEGSLRVTRYEQTDRMLRAARTLALCWLMAAVTVFIPVLHFVLVPGFLLAGPILAYLKYRSVESLEAITGLCPAHKGELNIVLHGDKMLPSWSYCNVCQAPLKLLVKNSS